MGERIPMDSPDQKKVREIVLPSLTVEPEEVIQQAVSGKLGKAILRLPREKKEAIKATFISSGGNISQCVREHDVTYQMVVKLAEKEDWPVYGGGTTSAEKGNKTRLIRLQSQLEAKMLALLGSMEVEKKQIDDIVEKRSMSKYVEPLASRNSAFKTVFDSWMRVSTLLEPEIYGYDGGNTNHVARNMRASGHPDALGGVEGVNREIADFLGRVAVGMADELKRRESNVIDHRPS